MWRGVAVVVVVVLAVLAAIWALQRRLIYLPSQAVPDVPGSVEAVTYTTEDDLELDGWFLPAPGDPLGAVLVFPGNAGDRSARVPLARALAGAGYSTLLVDYRGYGGNPGSPSEEGLARDARSALAYLESRDDVDPDQIVYFGESLGSGVAVQLAIEEPPAALILRSPFPSLAHVGSVHYPALPVSLLLRDRFDNADKIQRIPAPLVVIAGSADRIVPTELSRDLYELAEERKEMVVIDGAGHNDFALLAGDEMIQEIVDFLARVMD
jgi:fermentation-respiration switch protein FrsA (DUF1100 family)